ncbi:hypothetical protein AGMMS50249_3560 [candidate division SR1 bacterium]|nr:hypothetical protein AGMMS50249_3560 [candidate division SR1 bacterium]
MADEKEKLKNQTNKEFTQEGAKLPDSPEAENTVNDTQKEVKELEVQAITGTQINKTKEEAETIAETKTKLKTTKPEQTPALQVEYLKTQGGKEVKNIAEYIQVMQDMKTKFEQQKKEIDDFDLFGWFSAAKLDEVRQKQMNEQKKKLIKGINDQIKYCDRVIHKHEKVDPTTVLTDIEKNAYLTTEVNYRSLDTSIRGFRNGTVEPYTEQIPGATKARTEVEGGYIIGDVYYDKSGTTRKATPAEQKRVEEDREKAYKRGGVPGLINKGLDLSPNMTQKQKNNWTALGTLGVFGGLIYGFYKLSKDKDGKFSLKKALLGLGVLSFGSNFLMGESLPSLVSKVFSGKISLDEVLQKLEKFQGDSPEQTSRSKETAGASSIMGAYTVGQFLKFKTDRKGNPTQYAAWHESNRQLLLKNGYLPVETFDTRFPQNATPKQMDQIFTNYFAKFGLNPDKLTDKQKQLTGDEIVQRIGANKKIVNTSCQKKGKKVDDKKLAGLNYRLIRDDFGESVLEEMDRKGMFVENLDANYSDERKTEKIMMFGSLENLSAYKALSPEKQQKIKSGFIEFYDKMPGDNKPKCHFNEIDGKIYMTSHTRQDGSSSGVELNLKDCALPNFTQNGIQIPFSKGDYKGLFATAYATNGIMNIVKDSTPQSEKPFSHRTAISALMLQTRAPIGGSGIYFDDKEYIEKGTDTQMLSNGRRGKMAEISPEISEKGNEYAEYLNYLWKHKKYHQGVAKDKSEGKRLQNNKSTANTSPEQQNTVKKHTESGTVKMRTERNNNPTAMTTDVAKTLGLVRGEDYVQGDVFPDNPNLFTARLLGEPVQMTMKAFNTAASSGIDIFYTKDGKARRTHTAMTNKEWYTLSDEEKKQVILSMLQREGGKLDNMAYYTYQRGNATESNSGETTPSITEKPNNKNEKKKAESPEKVPFIDENVDDKPLPQKIYDLMIENSQKAFTSKDGYFINSGNNPYITIGLDKNGYSVKKLYNIRQFMDLQNFTRIPERKQAYRAYVKKDLNETLKIEQKNNTEKKEMLANYQTAINILKTQQLTAKTLYGKDFDQLNQFYQAFFNKFNARKVSFKSISNLNASADSNYITFDFNMKNTPNEAKGLTFRMKDITDSAGNLDYKKFYAKTKAHIDKLI